MNQHRDAAYRMDRNLIPTEMLDAALTGWDEVVALGEKTGFRNGQLIGPGADRHHRLHDGLRHDRR